MTIVMNMSSYVIEEMPAAEVVCCDEARLAAMNPSLELAIQQYEVTSRNRHSTMPASLANENAEMFLRRMCTAHY